MWVTLECFEGEVGGEGPLAGVHADGTDDDAEDADDEAVPMVLLMFPCGVCGLPAVWTDEPAKVAIEPIAVAGNRVATFAAARLADPRRSR